MIEIVEGLQIPEEDLVFITSRSGGPGGQNVNKVSSRVTLRYDLEASKALTADQRDRIRAKLASRITKDGILQVTSQRTRSQEMNRADVVDRFAELLRGALHTDKARIKTKATRASQEERLQGKKRKTQVKLSRSRKAWDE
jgi:ribosome-associated protein